MVDLTVVDCEQFFVQESQVVFSCNKHHIIYPNKHYRFITILPIGQDSLH